MSVSRVCAAHRISAIAPSMRAAPKRVAFPLASVPRFTLTAPLNPAKVSSPFKAPSRTFMVYSHILAPTKTSEPRLKKTHKEVLSEIYDILQTDDLDFQERYFCLKSLANAINHPGLGQEQMNAVFFVSRFENQERAAFYTTAAALPNIDEDSRGLIVERMLNHLTQTNNNDGVLKALPFAAGLLKDNELQEEVFGTMLNMAQYHENPVTRYLATTYLCEWLIATGEDSTSITPLQMKMLNGLVEIINGSPLPSSGPKIKIMEFIHKIRLANNTNSNRNGIGTVKSRAI